MLFDLDDTIIDHSYSVKCTLGALWMMNADLRRFSLHEVIGKWRSSFWNYWPSVISGKMSITMSRALRFRDLFRELGISADPEVYTDLAIDFDTLYIICVRPVSGAVPLLRELRERGVKVGIVTNTTKEMLHQKMSRCSIDGLVDFAVSVETAGKLKPDPSVFNLALTEGNAKPDETVYIGDTIKYDVMGALFSCIKPIWFNRFNAKLPDSVKPVDTIRRFEPARVIADRILDS